MTIPVEPESLLTREAAAEALTAAGFPVSPETLATKASRGGGPRFRKFGPRALYSWDDLLSWARSKLSPPITSTSQLSNARPAPVDRGAEPEEAVPLS
jgi:hypothetical protein